ncbi:uncharacterized protein DUF4383 [Kineococcus xinjiangensis]|uniref:Uncharacterized protein DUF4383 n=1 Tax=Kineococcus xinjiangensis TaxID=512762 RepID=A0A2S6ICY4_9ACTN|nr:DUF4383 domain-containing protein [Kineococcus xinjiangensis]PPK92084.1 uncharacterized protein DUF4383 [Kineococcus xinjiangensis]
MSLNMSGRTATTTPRRTAGQWMSLAVGATFLLVGVAGFFVTGFSDWTRHDPDQQLLGFAVNPLHNVLHVLVGVLGLVAWARRGLARWFGVLLFVGYGALMFHGIATRDDPAADVLNLNQADDVLHGVTAALGLIIALVPTKTPVRPSTAQLD